jgi:hypothetical protein
MREIDQFSRIVGAMGCFNEMISCGAKKLALGAPVYDEKERDEHLEFAKEICEKRGTKWYKDDDALLTDLFEVSLNKDKHNIVFYKEEKYLEEYLSLKKRKKELVSCGKYDKKERYKLAYDFGKLLSYSDAEINRMIDENEELEEFVTDKITVCSQISFLYFDDLQNAKKFFSEILGFEVACDQGYDYCCIYKVSESSFIGVVDRNRGAVRASTRDGVLTSLVVDNADYVYEKLKKLNLNELTDLKRSERLNIKSIMFTGPEGYRFEVEEFLDQNTRKFFYK